MDDSFKNLYYHWKNWHWPVVSNCLFISLLMYWCYMCCLPFLRQGSHLHTTVKQMGQTPCNCLYRQFQQPSWNTISSCGLLHIQITQDLPDHILINPAEYKTCLLPHCCHVWHPITCRSTLPGLGTRERREDVSCTTQLTLVTPDY